MQINVQHVAKLANLQLTSEEVKKFEKQLSETLSYIEELNEINTENITPTSQVTGLTNVLREDKISDSLSQKAALANTKNHYKGFFKVKGVLNSE